MADKNVQDIARRAQACRPLLEDKKGLDCQLINLEGRSSLADYFVLASGSSVPHVRALADYVEEYLEKEEALCPLRQEGRDTGRWILLDYGDFVVHVFHEEERAFYSLDRLWEKTEGGLKLRHD